jgi:hypothetical protein
MKDTIRIGLVARADFTGLGNQSQDWAYQLPIAKVLVVWGFKEASPEIYQKFDMKICEVGVPNMEEIDWFLKDIDIAIFLETPYNWTLISEAKKRGIKTIINPNYEMLLIDLPAQPDLWLCTNILNFETIPTDNKIYLPQPINRDVFKFKKRKKAKTFLFNNGNGGIHGRNGLKEFTEAIKFVNSDVKFIINSQVPVDIIPDSRIDVNIGEQSLKNIWGEGDVFVHLRKFGAMSLPMNEAMSLGMPIIGINRKPENTYLPKELLVDAEGKYQLQCGEDKIFIEALSLSPVRIAAKIDEWANKDISELSERMNELADKWDWNNWKDKYIETIYNLVNDLPLKNYENETVDIRRAVD